MPQLVKKAKRPAPPPETVEETPQLRKVPRPSSYAPQAARPEAKPPNRVAMWVAFAVAGIGFAVAARWARQRELTPPAPPQQVVMTAPVTSAPAPLPTEQVAPAP